MRTERTYFFKMHSSRSFSFELKKKNCQEEKRNTIRDRRERKPVSRGPMFLHHSFSRASSNHLEQIFSRLIFLIGNLIDAATS